MSSAKKHDNRTKPKLQDEDSIKHVSDAEETTNAFDADRPVFEPPVNNESAVLAQQHTLTDNDDLTRLIEQLEAERDEWKDKAYRFGAEVQNLGKQAQLDIAQARKSSKKSVVSVVASFFNTLNLSFAYAPASEDPAVNTFVQMLRHSFEQAQRDLAGIGVEVIIPSIGDPFDPEFMEILNPEAMSSDIQPHVKQVVSIGLRIDGQLVQSASVMV